MAKLNRLELLSRDAYATQREALCSQAAVHKRARRIGLGEHAVLQFEDRLTVQQRLHEWLWHSQPRESAAIQFQLDAHNVLIPEGRNLKATLQFEYTNSAQRSTALANLGGIEERIYGEVEGLGRSNAIVEEILVLDESGEPHSVQFLRFEFSSEQIITVRAGAEFGFGIDDDRMRVAHTLKRASRAAVLADFEQS